MDQRKQNSLLSFAKNIRLNYSPRH